MNPALRLTQEELRYNSYYDEGARRGVLLRRYPATGTITLARQSVVLPFVSSRRGRVWSVTWSGDVYALKVLIQTTTGERLTVDATHIPLLSGHAPTSTRSVSGAMLPTYPVAPGVAIALHAAPAWQFLIEPNLVLPGAKQLNLEYTLENPSDPNIAAGNSYTINQVVHVWEFPGFRGSAI